MNDYLLPILIIGTYLIGIPIVYAIIEDPNDKGPFEAAAMSATIWPIMLLFFIFLILAYPFYWITKKIKNKLKH